MGEKEKAYLLGLYEKAMPSTLTWKEKLQAAKEAGFDTVEISVDETDDKLARLNMSLDERMEMVKTMYEVGIPVRSMCLSGHRKFPMGSDDSDTNKRSMEIMEKAIQLADDLGIRIIQLAGYDVYYKKGTEETKMMFAENLEKAVAMAAKRGIILSFETMETEFMNTVEKAMKYVTLIDSPYLQVYPDAGNITNAAAMYNTDPADDLETGRGHISSMHLKETVPGKFREIPYGTGHVDFSRMIEKGWNLGVRFYVSEFWYVGNPEWKKELRDVNEMLTKLLDERQALSCQTSKC